MATAETVQIGPIHAPKEDSIIAFNKIETELKRKIQHLRHETDKHEPQYFAPISHVSDHTLTSFDSSSLKSVRVANSAYGLHLLGKVLIPETEDRYFMFRAFIPGDSDTAKLHCIHMEEKDVGGEEGKKFRAIFEENDELDWFDE
ncbi:hypothetical protein SS1G_14386 [Sclerotinia sclerotiorum 1980 UF-70]|uniref:Uncharacterized protein n=2 Tax=Sclerotinia sclerotiorum (strain ATCC 18683 / 1980 / Ss-1) TaxID=665079 RepID=A7F9V5_SCLS1|nr:hypothetical protein SS1G_14386 [Sclerotinia sclerotiorum 1980 UF-70]APA14925.1 hypothetical protein sscle_13g096950 [Sclerotinia sclerotiorum 1980 UF-70]EDO00516.1 hypothetical protein SS1G_14386 [Sclerotinia sclerotiorum 1980 UF-70]